MRKVLIISISSAIVIGVSWRLWSRPQSKLSAPNTNSANGINAVVNAPAVNQTVPSNASATVSKPMLVYPISDYPSRVTKKPFGIYITPKNSPVQPERFQGFHTGADAETTPAEQSIDVPISAIADGTVLVARWASGYGGVILIEHQIAGQAVTAVYGHLRQSSFRVQVGSTVKVGEQIAVLGNGFSKETDGERKHLHFALLKGKSTTLLGYVSIKSALSSWLDPAAFFK